MCIRDSFIMVVAFPCAVGLAVFGLPIFNILFSSTRATNAEASLMMYVGAVADVYKRQHPHEVS